MLFERQDLLEACIGPIKKPINNAKDQKNSLVLMNNSRNVRIVRLIIQIQIVFLDPILSSNLAKNKHPIIPARLIKIPRSKISFSLKLNKIEANKLANAKIHITALL